MKGEFNFRTTEQLWTRPTLTEGEEVQMILYLGMKLILEDTSLITM
jgi:hypothetical protein